MDASQLVTIGSNEDEERARIADGGWTPIYGTLIDDEEYVRLGGTAAAAAISGNPTLLLKYFGDLIARTSTRCSRPSRVWRRRPSLTCSSG